MKDRWKVLLVVLSVAGLTATMVVVLLVHIFPAAAQDSCSGVQVNPGDDLDAIVNGDPPTSATTICIHAGTYLIDQVVVPRDGDALVGEPGTSTVIGPATKPEPVVLVRNAAALSRLVQPTGSNIHLEWLDISGANVRYDDQTQDTCDNWGEVANKCPQAGTGVAIASGKADGTLLITHVRVWGNEGLGIGNAKGSVLHSEFFDNTRNPDWVGFEGAGVKGVTEFEAAYNFVHDEQGNGLWCDHACADDAARVNGAWFHHNLVVNNARWGIRYEFSPIVASGVHSSQPTFLAENNEVHGNGLGGASMVDAQNGTFRANVFGPTMIADVSYAANYNNRAIFFRDSGRAERTDLWKGDATGNELNGETIVGCEKPDDIVDCHDTTSPTLSSVAPTAGAATVALDANVAATFSEAMNASTITDATFTLTLGGTPVLASVSYDPTTRKATLNPNVALQAGQTYIAKVKGGSVGVKDLVGNPLAADEVWSFTTLPPPDTTPPETSISSCCQPDVSKSTTASFSFTGSDDRTPVSALKFECRLDSSSNSDWLPCTSPQNYPGLSDGTHKFEVRAIDAALIPDPTPASRGFKIDTTPPDTTITSGPSGTVNLTSASFAFDSSESNSRFKCKVSGGVWGDGSSSACQVPWDIGPLPEGTYTFEVYAVDSVGNADPDPATRTWTVDTSSAVPMITSPNDNSFDTDGNFTVSGSGETGSTVKLFEGSVSKGTAQVDSFGKWSIPLSGVAEGLHTYTAKATDAANNTSGPSNPTTVKVDTIKPTVIGTTPLSGATGVGRGTNLTATFSEKMRASSVNATNFKLLKVNPDGSTTQITNVSVSLSTDGLTATLNPFGSSTTVLARGTKYKAVVTTGATDVAGLRLDQISSTTSLDQKTWTFTTSN
jgi:hypothetical protein